MDHNLMAVNKSAQAGLLQGMTGAGYRPRLVELTAALRIVLEIQPLSNGGSRAKTRLPAPNWTCQTPSNEPSSRGCPRMNCGPRRDMRSCLSRAYCKMRRVREVEQQVPGMPEYRNRSSAPQISHAMPAGDYVKMFPDLSALRIDEGVLRSLAQEMARPSCVGENPDCPAGYTYFGQFIAHDISLMCKTGNRRRAALKLESVYGSADEDWSGLYRDGEAGDVMFVLGVGCDRQGRPSNEYDLPRRAGGMPGIPDPRNDFHTIISQLHLAFMRLHNRVARGLRRVSPEKSPTAIFAETRRKICWLYQWLVVNDFLRRICDRELMRHVWPGDNVVDPRFASFISQYEQKIPYEFALAGFRFGHSMVRPAYRLNCALPPRPIFHEHGDTFWKSDLRGHRELLVRWSVQWAFCRSRQSPTAVFLHVARDCTVACSTSAVHHCRGCKNCGQWSTLPSER